MLGLCSEHGLSMSLAQLNEKGHLGKLTMLFELTTCFLQNAKTNRQVRRCESANQLARAHPDWIRHHRIANSVWSIANKSYCRMVYGNQLSPFDPLPLDPLDTVR
jgi:hypothetical protein